MKAIGKSTMVSLTASKLVIVRPRVNGPDAVIELTIEETHELFDYWLAVRPKPSVKDLESILNASE